jgi:hypothetical protein
MIWTVTATNRKRMPVDADPVAVDRGFRLDPDPEDVLSAAGEVIVATFTMQPAPGERLYVSHFATCPKAAAHRRGK